MFVGAAEYLDGKADGYLDAESEGWIVGGVDEYMDGKEDGKALG